MVVQVELNEPITGYKTKKLAIHWLKAVTLFVRHL